MPAARKKKVTQGDIARNCKVDQGSVSRILNKDTRDSFSPDTIQKVFQTARELGYVHPALVSTNRRHSPRKKAGMRASLAIVIGTSTIYDRGSCEIHELSGSGMLLKNFTTKRGTLPMDRF
ncbi:MAG TPA: helix-turn-helix domain-containing protein, partial [Planctomycetota bacterium]|nr:helix-turn-helix domain-containing protein [Planctomycetota bacterium]